MNTPIMPQGTAVWLIENTSLTFDQISDFCGLHKLEVQALADEQGAIGIIGVDPIKLGQLTPEEIDRCSKNPAATLVLCPPKFQKATKKTKKKYVPFIKRRDRPDAVAWLLKNYPDMSDNEVASLLSTTKNTVLSIRNKTHVRAAELNPRDPVFLGFCSQIDLDKVVSKYQKRNPVVEDVDA